MSLGAHIALEHVSEALELLFEPIAYKKRRLKPLLAIMLESREFVEEANRC